MNHLLHTTLQRTLAVCILLAGFALTAYSQDVIVLKTGERINARIIEVNDVEIKYREYRDPNGIIFTMARGKISEIRYESGRREKEEGPVADPAYYIDDRRNNIKINFLSVGGSTTILEYERAIDPKSSIGVQLKINGLGFSNNDNKSGVGLDLGYKLKLGSIFKKRGDYRPRHLLAGGYFRPVVGFNTVNADYGEFNSYTYGHFGLDFGVQWIINNIVSLDLFGGWHYYAGNFDRRVQGDFEYQYFTDGNLFGVSDHSAIAFGFNVGILFGSDYNPRKNKKRRR